MLFRSNVSTPAIMAGTAAMEDVGFIEQAIAHNTRWLEWVSAEVRKLGLEVTPSVGNFILIHFATAEKAAAADAHLMSAGIIVRRVDSYSLPKCLRVSIGSQEANHAFISALTEFMK